MVQFKIGAAAVPYPIRLNMSRGRGRVWRDAAHSGSTESCREESTALVRPGWSPASGLSAGLARATAVKALGKSLKAWRAAKAATRPNGTWQEAHTVTMAAGFLLLFLKAWPAAASPALSSSHTFLNHFPLSCFVCKRKEFWTNKSTASSPLPWKVESCSSGEKWVLRLQGRPRCQGAACGVWGQPLAHRGDTVAGKGAGAGGF